VSTRQLAETHRCHYLIDSVFSNDVYSVLNVQAPDMPGAHMAKQTVIHMTDDLDGSEATQTVDFSYRGTAARLTAST
jgi:predicted DNA-binding protein (MmcQ/YjbR family)